MIVAQSKGGTSATLGNAPAGIFSLSFASEDREWRGGSHNTAPNSPSLLTKEDSRHTSSRRWFREKLAGSLRQSTESNHVFPLSVQTSCATIAYAMSHISASGWLIIIAAVIIAGALEYCWIVGFGR